MASAVQREDARLASALLDELLGQQGEAHGRVARAVMAHEHDWRLLVVIVEIATRAN